MLHKVFNGKEQMQWHRTETKKHVCRVQGGAENFPRTNSTQSACLFPFSSTPLQSQPTKSSPEHWHPPPVSRKLSKAEENEPILPDIRAKQSQRRHGKSYNAERSSRLKSLLPGASGHPAHLQAVATLQLMCSPCCLSGMICQLQQFRLQQGGGRHSPEPPRPREPPEEMGTPPALRELPTAADREDPTAVL